HAPQELPDEPAPFAREESPVDTAAIDLVEQEQVEPTARLMIPLQDQAPVSGVTSSDVRLDRNRLHIEEREEGAAGAVMPPPSQAGEDPPPIGIGVVKSLRSMRRRVYPPEHPTEVLPADRFDNPLPNQVIAMLGQSPAAERQAQGRRRLARQAPDG